MPDLERMRRYEVVEANGFVAWLCRRCPTIHVDASLDGEGEPTQKGVTLADLYESANDHEREEHAADGESA